MDGWSWDETLYRGSAAYYARGRLRYPAGLGAAIRDAAGLDGTARLLDVGTGPGSVALLVAPYVAEVVGLDADADMVAVAAERAEAAGVINARWVHARAEELPLGLGPFRAVTFAQSFHWMDRARVASAVRAMLEPGGVLVHVSAWMAGEPVEGLPAPPRPRIRALVAEYLGPQRRAGQGHLPSGTPGDEAEVLAGAGFTGPEVTEVSGGEIVRRSIDDIVAEVFSVSGSAPHLFGDRIDEFERDLRGLLTQAAADGGFTERIQPVELRVWRPGAGRS